MKDVVKRYQMERLMFILIVIITVEEYFGKIISETTNSTVNTRQESTIEFGGVYVCHDKNTGEVLHTYCLEYAISNIK